LYLEETLCLNSLEGSRKNFDPKTLKFRAGRFFRLVSRDLSISSSGGSHDFHVIMRADSDPADPKELYLNI
jgi:hypothetical protein